MACARSRRASATPCCCNTPTVFNAAFETLLNWDGSAETLERHAELVLLNPDLMNTTWPELLRKLRTDRNYLAAFARAYPEGLSQRTVLDALATFERSLQTPGSRFDRYLRGEIGALTPASVGAMSSSSRTAASPAITGSTWAATCCSDSGSSPSLPARRDPAAIRDASR